jgi:phospholipase C
MMFPVVTGVKILLSTVSPLQRLIDRPGYTHEFCNQQALLILEQDGFNRAANFIHHFLPELNAGIYWADEGWKNVSHYFEPVTKKGLWHFANAIDDFWMYYQGAMACSRSRDYRRAIFLLGAAAHLVQDVCVPHHARAKLFHGHKEYEAWAQKHYANYSVQSQGMYREGQPAPAFPLANADIAADLFDWVNTNGDEKSYHQATAISLPLAQRTTAGLFLHFMTVTGLIANKAACEAALIRNSVA